MEEQADSTIAEILTSIGTNLRWSLHAISTLILRKGGRRATTRAEADEMALPLPVTCSSSSHGRGSRNDNDSDANDQGEATPKRHRICRLGALVHTFLALRRRFTRTRAYLRRLRNIVQNVIFSLAGLLAGGLPPALGRALEGVCALLRDVRANLHGRPSAERGGSQRSRLGALAYVLDAFKNAVEYILDMLPRVCGEAVVMLAWGKWAEVTKIEELLLREDRIELGLDTDVMESEDADPAASTTLPTTTDVPDNSQPRAARRSTRRAQRELTKQVSVAEKALTKSAHSRMRRNLMLQPIPSVMGIGVVIITKLPWPTLAMLSTTVVLNGLWLLSLWHAGERIRWVKMARMLKNVRAQWFTFRYMMAAQSAHTHSLLALVFTPSVCWIIALWGYEVDAEQLSTVDTLDRWLLLRGIPAVAVVCWVLTFTFACGSTWTFLSLVGGCVGTSWDYPDDNEAWNDNESEEDERDDDNSEDDDQDDDDNSNDLTTEASDIMEDTNEISPGVAVL